jgi:class 3 adenylate cyclase/tetratricopeptide (TPR) repeat protein
VINKMNSPLIDVEDWLKGLNLERYVSLFRENDIDERSLPYLTSSDLREIGVSSVGHRRVLLEEIEKLKLAIEASAYESVAQPVKDNANAVESSRGDAPSSDEGGRRQLTIMFCDLVKSTALANFLDPEDLRDVFQSYQDCCAKSIEAYEGHIAQYRGDGVLAYFGYPEAHEDDAERAVRAGLRVIEAVEGLHPKQGGELQVRVGIATGLVLVSDIVGKDSIQKRAVIGDAPALAARLQMLAEPNSVVISPATKNLVGEIFVSKKMADQSIKGYDRPIAPWRVEGIGRKESRFEALRGDRLSTFVGREQELSLLLDRWERSKTGESQVVMLEGDAGIGKSRLVQELRERLTSETCVVMAHYCSLYQINSALYPIIQLIHRAAGFNEDDPPHVRLSKLEALLARGTSQLDEAVPLVADVLGIPSEPRYSGIHLSPDRKAQRTLEILVEQLAGLSSERPVLAIFEDVHWVDPTTLELLNMIIETLQRVRVFTVITYRKINMDYTARWNAHGHTTTLSLSKLTRPQAIKIIESVGGGLELSKEIANQIVERSDGIPLFVEELTKSVIDATQADAPRGPKSGKRIDSLIYIPMTLQDSLMSRLDKLVPGKEVAQLASVVGREFRHSTLAAITSLSNERLQLGIEQLINAELIFARGSRPDARYMFNHNLIQEVAYESLLRSQRRQYHRSLARVIEREKDQISLDQAVLLGYHNYRGNRPSKAFKYNLLAGDLALRMNARTEATTYYTEALTIACESPGSSRAIEWQIDAYLKLAATATTKEEIKLAKVRLDEASKLARGLGDSGRLARLLYWSGRLAYVSGEFETSIGLAEQSLEIADRLDDVALSAPPTNLVGRAKYLVGEFGRASELLIRNVRQMQELGDPIEEATAAGFAGISLVAIGQFDRGVDFVKRGLNLSKKLKNPFVEAAAYNYCAVAYCHLAKWSEAIEDCEKARRAAEQAEDKFRIYLVQYYEGQAYTMAGDPVHGRKLLEDSISLAEEFGTKNLLALGKSHLAKCLMNLGQIEGVPALCRESVELAKATHDRLAAGMAYRTLAEALQAGHDGDRREAEHAINKAIRIQKAQNIVPELARSYASYANLLTRWNDHVKAQEYRSKAKKLFENHGMTWDLAHHDMTH